MFPERRRSVAVEDHDPKHVIATATASSPALSRWDRSIDWMGASQSMAKFVSVSNRPRRGPVISPDSPSVARRRSLKKSCLLA